MAYNRENKWKRIAEIQDIVLEYKKKDVPQKIIFEKYIRDKYHISYSCFNEYLGVPAKAQLKELQDKREDEERKQLNLFE